jgi:signal peptidase I
MEPTLGIGDLAIVERVAPDQVRTGDIVAIALGSGATLTHRVQNVQANDDGPFLTTRGDANTTQDPVAVRPEQVRGRAISSVAFLGFVIAMLAMPSGVAALFSIGATILTAVWMLGEVESGLDEDELEAELDILRRSLDADAAGVA